MWTWAYAWAGSAHTAGAGDRWWADCGEGCAEVGIGRGFSIEMGESLTRRGFLANCLTFLLREPRFDWQLVERKLPWWWYWWCPGWYLQPKLYLAQSSPQPSLNWQCQRAGEEQWQTDAPTSSQISAIDAFKYQTSRAGGNDKQTKGKVHKKRRKKLTNVSIDLTPTYIP